MRQKTCISFLLTFLLLFEGLNGQELHKLEPVYDSGCKLHYSFLDIAFQNHDQMLDLLIYKYDFEKLEKLEKKIKGKNRKSFLQKIFKIAITKSDLLDDASDQDKWYAVIDYLNIAIPYLSLQQPMYEDKTMVTDPMTLLLLGDGRCGHFARIVVDLALANEYEARLVQLACHLIAEVKWNGKWHFIDADAFNSKFLSSIFSELPNVYELSKTPYILDSMPHNVGLSSADILNRRTAHGQVFSFPFYYSGSLLISSMYFAKEILDNSFTGDKKNGRNGVIYYYKKGSFEKWQNDRYFGWSNLSQKKEKINPIPLGYKIELPKLAIPSIIYSKNKKATIPIRFTPAFCPTINSEDVFDCFADSSQIDYEIRVSSNSRGWDYNFLNYKKVSHYNNGDLGIFRDVKKFEHGVYGLDIELEYNGDVFIEVIAKHEVTHKKRKAYAWPSAEGYIKIFP